MCIRLLLAALLLPQLLIGQQSHSGIESVPLPQRSPYFLGEEMPGQLRTITTSMVALGIMTGGDQVTALAPMSGEDYYNEMKSALALGSVESLNESETLAGRIDDLFKDAQGLSVKATDVFTQLESAVQSARMRAVRMRSPDVQALTDLAGKLKTLKRLGGSAETLLRHSGSIRDALVIAARAAGPVQSFAEADQALSLLAASPSVLPLQKRAAEQLRRAIADESSRFWMNLANSGGSMLAVATQLGGEILSANEKQFQTYAERLLGAGNVRYIAELAAARRVMRGIVESVLPIDGMLNAARNSYISTMTDVPIHQTYMEIQRVNPGDPRLRPLVKLMYLVEAQALTNVGSLLEQGSAMGNFQQAIGDARRLSREAIETVKTWNSN